MGIEIISVLAKNCSQLSTISGVKLQEQVDSQGHRISLADPQKAPGKYVEEVISQWSIGNSHRPPIWRELLQVLQNIGLPELSQQIDVYIKGKYFYIDY